jgi:hypothetical protein
MATASALKNGQDYEVSAGPLKGVSVTIVDNHPVPDGQPNQRKILVSTPDGTSHWLLPRVIDDGTKALAAAVAASVQQQPFPVSHRVVEEQIPLTDPMDPRLDSYRPDPAIVKHYLSRTLPGDVKDTDLLLRLWRQRENVMLVGDTQSGKTMLVQVLAVLAAREAGLPKPLPVFTLSGSNGITDFDLFGQPTAWTDPETGQEQLVWLPGIVDIACRVGGFLYLDEANMMEDRVVSSLNPICDDRRFFVNRQKAVKVPGDGFMPEIVTASPDLWIIGTYNDGYKGAGALQEAFSNRFIHLPWDYDAEVEKKLVRSNVVRTVVGEALRTARTNNQIHTPVGTKALMKLEKLAYEQGAALAVWAFLGMFPGRDRERVEIILRDRTVVELLEDEIRSSVPQPTPESGTF